MEKEAGNDDLRVMTELASLSPVRFRKNCYKFGNMVVGPEEGKALVRLKRQGEAVSILGLLEAKAFVAGMTEVEASRLMRACVERLGEKKTELVMGIATYEPCPQTPKPPSPCGCTGGCKAWECTNG